MARWQPRHVFHASSKQTAPAGRCSRRGPCSRFGGNGGFRRSRRPSGTRPWFRDDPAQVKGGWASRQWRVFADVAIAHGLWPRGLPRRLPRNRPEDVAGLDVAGLIERDETSFANADHVLGTLSRTAIFLLQTDAAML